MKFFINENEIDINPGSVAKHIPAFVAAICTIVLAAGVVVLLGAP